MNIDYLNEDEFFDYFFYREHNPDLRNMGYNEIIHHYQNYGKKEHRFGSEAELREYIGCVNFDIKFYKQQNPDLNNMSLKDLVNHYKNYGRKEGRLSSAQQIREHVGDEYFNLDFYRENSKDLNHLSNRELVNHYKNYGKKEGRFGSLEQIRKYVDDPDFDLVFYKKHNNDLINMCLKELVNHYKNYGKKEGRFSSLEQIRKYISDPKFDLEFYRKHNNDLVNMSLKELLNHYKNYGKKEGRLSSIENIRDFVDDKYFDLKFYRQYNPDLNHMNNIQLVNHYKKYGKKEKRVASNISNNLQNIKNKDFLLKYNLYTYTNDNTSSLPVTYKIYTHDINLKTISNNHVNFDNCILIIDFPKLGGGTTTFLRSILEKYKYNQTFIILRNYKDGIIITINDDYKVGFDKTYICDEECVNFLISKQNNIKKIFINHTLRISEYLILSLKKLNKEITYLTHDYFLLFNTPQPTYEVVNKKINLRQCSLINQFDNIITQNINNLNIFDEYLNKNKNIIVSELPDCRKSLNIYKTNNKTIIIGILGFINDIKGKQIIIELNQFISDNKLNMEIIVFGHINCENIKNMPYNCCNHLNNLLIKYKPNVLLECSLWQETYSYTLTLSMLTKLPILSFYKEYKYVINNRLSNYDKSYYFNDIKECVDLINTHKQEYLYTIEPVIYYNSFWDNYFQVVDNTSINNTIEYNKLIDNIDIDTNNKIHEIIEPFAIYFPQFHRIPENDLLFYDGYTDMINLIKIKQTNDLNGNILTPLKGVLDNYDIVSNKNLIISQIKLAKKFGIKGFAFYHYWFDNNLIIEGRNNIMEDFTEKIINIDDDTFSFFLIWANEKWCDNLYSEYKFNIENLDKHFDNLLKYFKDKKYKKINNKPIFAILQHYTWKNDEFNKFTNYFNTKCIEKGFNGIYIITIVQHNLMSKPETDGVYINVPSWKNSSMFGDVYKENNTHYVDYNYYVENFETELLKNIPKNKDIIFNIFPNFDNYVRNYFKKTMMHYSYINSSLDNFEKYLDKIINLSKKYKNDSKILLINSWNEWGENMAIEPSNELKYSYLEIIYDKLVKNIN
jgi:hypothetical protein